jgi:arginosuccinate synthase-like protein
MFGVKEIFVDDLCETFVKDFVFPMFHANTVFESQYLLGTSIARPLIAQRRIVHTLTGKGVQIEFVKEQLTFTGEDSPMASLLLSVMGAFADDAESEIMRSPVVHLPGSPAF